MRRLHLFCALLFSMMGSIGFAQSINTQGTDFWVTFGTNYIYTYAEVSLQIRVVTTTAATVTFSYTADGTSYTIPLAANTVYTRDLTATEKNNVYAYNITAGIATHNKSLRIQSNVPVSVYALSQSVASTDATNVLPVSNLGTEYYHISYMPVNGYPYDGYSVVAVEDGTNIYANGTLIASNLRAGEGYNKCGNVDMTGEHITTNKPVAYFVTALRTNIPINYGTSDCLFQQLPPVSQWGWNFFVPVTHRGIERVRVLATQDGTSITQSGGTVKTGSSFLNAGQFAEIEITLANKGCFITADKPVGVCSFLPGINYPFIVYYSGDPAIAWIAPIEQMTTDVTTAPFIPSGSTNLNEHYALIISATATKMENTMAIGAATPAALTGGQWYDHTAGYSFYSLPLTRTDSSYSFNNPNGLFVMGYGLGNAESYYYLAGSAARTFADFYLNDTHYLELNGGTLCDTNVRFMADIKNAYPAPGHLKWYVDGVLQPAVTDSTAWDGILSRGVHSVQIAVTDINNLIDTFSTSFMVSLPCNDTITAAICLGETYAQYNFNETPTETGISYHTQHLKTVHFCDSVVTLQLTTHPVYNDTIRAAICLGETYAQYDFNETPTETGISYRTQHLKTVHFCDSIVTLQLTTHPVYNDTIRAAICIGETYAQYNFNVTPADTGISYHTQYLKTIHLCDSVVTLQLATYPVYDDTIRATICLGETYAQYNFNVTPTVAGLSYHTQYLKTVQLCDSLVTLQLTTHPAYNDTIRAKISFGHHYAAYNFNVTPVEPGFAYYTQYLKTAHGCDSIVNLVLEVIPPAHTAFSPFNRDGINDYFMSEFKIQVFNRHGTLVYETRTQEQLTLGWDGTDNNGRPVDPGMYFYILYNSHGQPEIKSSVEVLRR